MLSITDKQYAALDHDARMRFRARLATWLQVHAPGAAAIDGMELATLIERQEPRAARFGLRTERQIAKWCILAVMTAERFDTIPAVQDRLATLQGMTPEQRLDDVLQQVAAAIDLANVGVAPPDA